MICCKGCTVETGRYLGCHDKCDKYLAIKQDREEKKKLERLDKQRSEGGFKYAMKKNLKYKNY